MRKNKTLKQQAKRLARPTRDRARPKNKTESPSWQRRNSARSALQAQYEVLASLPPTES